MKNLKFIIGSMLLALLFTTSCCKEEVCECVEENTFTLRASNFSYPSTVTLCIQETDNYKEEYLIPYRQKVIVTVGVDYKAIYVLQDADTLDTFDMHPNPCATLVYFF